MAKVSLACAGYRLDSKSGGHHVAAFQALPIAIGPIAKSYELYFDVCRRKRNEIDYDRAFVASDADADEIVRKSIELQMLVENWIAITHPAYAK